MDANLNRAREGLRVCEEIARLILEDSALTRKCRRLRYDAERSTRRFASALFLKSRDAGSDVGRPSRRSPAGPHRNVAALATANLRRVQEALRVLEEFGRLRSAALARSFGILRFRAYSLEQAFHSRLPSLRHR